MQRYRDGFEVKPYPLSRRIVVDSAHQSHRKHSIHGLLEIDITTPRTRMRDYKATTGSSLSFTAFVASCLGQAVDAHKHVHAYRNWRNQLILFDEVDIATSIEIELERKKFPLSHIIRAANRRTVADIHREIRSIQNDPQASKSMNTRTQQLMPVFLRLPRFLRNSFYQWLFSSPQTMKQTIGTVQLTAVGMFGQGGGWAVTPSLYTLGVAVGGMTRKPGIVDDRIEPREYLNLTLTFDHDIVDGAPAARFASHLTDLLESGHGLDDL